MKKVKKIFGERLKGLRRARNMTQGELAAELGIHNSYIGLLERGDRAPSLKTLASAAGFFGVKPADLLMEESKREKLSYKQKEIIYMAREGAPEEIDKLYKISKMVINGHKKRGRKK